MNPVDALRALRIYLERLRFPVWPLVRLDYVWTTPVIQPENATRLPPAGSDHFAVRAVVRMPITPRQPAPERTP